MYVLSHYSNVSTECSAGSNDHFVVVVSIFSPVRWKATRWRSFSVLALRNHATLQRNNHATLHVTEQSRSLATQQSRNLQRNNHPTLQRNLATQQSCKLAMEQYAYRADLFLIF
jgi:hypothetical protein